MHRSGQVALYDRSRSQFLVNTIETVRRDRLVRDRVRQFFGLKIRVVCEDPHMPELMSDDRPQIFIVEHVQKSFFKGNLKGACATLERLNGDDQVVLRHDDNTDLLGNSELLSEFLDDVLKLPGVVFRAVAAGRSVCMNDQDKR